MCDVELLLTLEGYWFFLELFQGCDNLFFILVIKVTERECQVITRETAYKDRPGKFYYEQSCIEEWLNQLFYGESCAPFLVFAWLVIRKDIIWVILIVQIRLNLIGIQV